AGANGTRRSGRGRSARGSQESARGDPDMIGQSSTDGRLSATARVIAESLVDARRPCITCSFQAEDMVVLHMLRQVQPDIPVLFLAPVDPFAQTYAYRDELAASWNLNLVNLRAAEPKPGLWQTSTDECCARHKVGPLFSALDPYDVSFTGLRRQQSTSRANLAEVEPFRLPSGRSLSKVSPLAMWTTKDVWMYSQA